MDLVKRTLLRWLPLATMIVVLSGVIYGAAQQVYRTSADDPQIQMATEARNALDAGQTPASIAQANLVLSDQIDIAKSYAPYIAIYDSNGMLLASSATLHGQAITPPPGVFASAKTMAVDLVTWQPEPGVRSAIAVVTYDNGYVLAGRSLALVEAREDDLLTIVAAGCVAALVLSFLATMLTEALRLRLKAITPAPR